MFCLTKDPNVANKDLRPEALNNPQFERQVCLKLEQAEKEAELTKQRYSTDDILEAVKSAIQNKSGNRHTR